MALASRTMLALAVLLLTQAAHAASFKVLYTFSAGGDDGGDSVGGLVRDKAGNLYGTTFEGGIGEGGTVYKLAPDGTFTVLHSFFDDGYSEAALLRDSAGNLYGTTEIGNSAFEIAADGTYSVLHQFGQGTDGSLPVAALIHDARGNLYGTTNAGGSSACSNAGCGSVFRISPNGDESVLYGFQNGSDGAYADAPLLLKAGELYGTTAGGGVNSAGTIFKVSKTGKETVLYAFTGGDDGAYPETSLVADAAGNLYGTAWKAGAQGCGTLFKLAPDGTFSTLVSFGGASGTPCEPLAGLLADAAGNLYGTTVHGGTHGQGTVYRLAAGGTLTVLHSFDPATDGAQPDCVLVADGHGNLYGTTPAGGANGSGTIFRLKE